MNDDFPVSTASEMSGNGSRQKLNSLNWADSVSELLLVLGVLRVN